MLDKVTLTAICWKLWGVFIVDGL